MGMHWARLFLSIYVGVTVLPAQSQTVSLLFGPASEEASAKAAAAAADRVTEWLAKPGRAVEVRRAGSRDGQELLKFMKPPQIQKTLLDAAREARGEEETQYLNAMEIASYSLSRAKGARVLVTLLRAPQWTPNGAARLKQILDDCQSKSIKVVAVALDGPEAAAVDGLTRVKDLDALEAALGPVEAGRPEPTITSKPPEAIPVPSDDLQVHGRMVKTTPISISKIGAKLGPMNGVLILETPMRSLHFQTSGNSYLARARMTAVVKDAGGAVVWQGSKDFGVKGPAGRLDERKTGNLYFVREVKLTAGTYLLESRVEDLNATTSAESTTEIAGKDSLPGLSASDAMFVRKFDRSRDVMQGDSVISYDGEALAPLLDPAFVANEPFELGLFFLFYPDMNGKQPVLRLDIRSGGQSVGGTQLAFTDSLRDDSRAGSGSAFAGEQKGQFPYLAKIANATFNAGRYEAVVEIEQDSVKLSRAVEFRVYRGGAKAGP